MLFGQPQDTTPPRRVMMPVKEVGALPPPGASTPALALFYKGSRDSLDYGIDFTDWLAQNGGTQITALTYAEADDSPQSPTIESQGFSPEGDSYFMISGGDPSDAYYIDCTVTIDAVQQRPEGSPMIIGSRTLVRRIHILVYAS